MSDENIKIYGPLADDETDPDYTLDEHGNQVRRAPMPDSIPAEQIYLAHDVAGACWSLWRRSHDRMVDQMLIDWFGEAQVVPYLASSAWDMTRYAAHEVAPEDVPAFDMAARHLDTQQWFAFAARYVERKQSRQII